MKIVKVILLPLMLLSLTIGIAFWLFSARSDEAEIRRIMSELCFIAGKPANEKAAAGLLKLRKIDQLFMPTCRIDVRHQFVDGNLTPENIRTMVMRYRPFFRYLDFSLHDMQIDFSADRKQAVCSFTARIRAAAKKDDRKYNESQDLFCTLNHMENHWRIAGIAIRDALEK